MENEIKELLYELGVPVIQRAKREAPNCISIHYDLVKIDQLNQLERKVKFLSAYLHKDIVYERSDIAHFSLRIPKEKEVVGFYDNEYDYVFNKNIVKDLDIFMGVDNDNVPRVFNLNDVSHILVAGTTGSGKSVMINNIICSLLRNCDKNHKPTFTMIDTKRVELSQYKTLGDDCKIATDPIKAIELLEDACLRVESRYALMEERGWRKIPDSYFRHIVVIEELGDLMLSSNGAVEKYIVKIAQLGRACGVHLIIATQRPTVSVVTGAIKANIGCRVALQTTSAIDSRNILGHNGAERLRGEGDCLLKLPNRSDEIHLQCPYISNDDIDRTIKDFKED